MGDRSSTNRGAQWTERIERELDERLSPEHPRRYATSDEPTSDPDELVAEQRRETDEMLGAPTLPFISGPMWKGMVGGGIAGAVLGALIMAPFALIPWGDTSFWVRLIWVLVIGIAAGAAAGAHYWGGRTPELSGESFDADNTPSGGSTLADPRTDEHGRDR